MNKNISFFIALAIFNFSFAQETTTENEQAIATENAQEITTEDKQDAIAELETSNPVYRSHNLTITIQPKDLNDTALFDEKKQELLNIIQSVHRTQDGSNLYNKILIFIKEAQEAIIAGLNLFSAATNSNSVQIVKAAAETVASEAPDAISQESEESTPAVQKDIATENESKESDASIKNIEFSINISLEKTEDEDLFDSLTAKMNDLILAINENSKSAEDVVTMLNDIILASQHLPNTNLTIKIN